MDSSLSQPPAPDQIEISLFGPGYGEAVLVHLGNSAWMAIDSCVNGGQLPHLDYLDVLGVDAASAVKMLVVSHWHDDHIRGLSRFFERAKSAALYYASALTTSEFQQFAKLLNADDPNPLVRETSEIFRTISRALADQRRREAVKSDQLLYRSATGDVEVYALSPSTAEFERFIRKISELMPRADRPEVRHRVGALRPNAAAIALQLRSPAGNVLLGSDLEENQVQGWSTMISSSVALRSGNSVFKIPHHGSETAYCQAISAGYLSPDCISTLTPFMRGNVTLPTAKDIARILAGPGQAFISAPLLRPAPMRRSNEVERALRRDDVRLRRAFPRAGHIRLRGSLGVPWSIELFGALPLSELAA